MITNFHHSDDYQKLANSLIPAGAHTYSKGKDQFPAQGPKAVVRGKGARVYDVDGNEFIDWGMGLSSVLLGHAYEPILEVVREELDNGVNFILPSHLEARVAKLLTTQIPSAQMVKFGKNGSNATTSAIRLARAYTKKDIVLKCQDNPFLAIDDWFICDTPMNSGIPESQQSLVKNFSYNNINEVKELVQTHKGKIACIILEPVMVDEPLDGFLHSLRSICDAEKIVLIFDEIRTGFRVHPKGAQYKYGVTPDLSSFGKAIANGFSASALVGKREIMELGGLEHTEDRVFLLSSTYGGETHHLRAIERNIEILNADDFAVTKHIYAVGKKIKESYNQITQELGLEKHTQIIGLDANATLVFKDLYLRTYFLQEMIKEGILMQAISPSYSHRKAEVEQTIHAFSVALRKVQKATTTGTVQELLHGMPIKPVFRKKN